MFLRGSNPIWSEFNTTGGIFDDTYYAFFLTNTLPYVPQSVFQDPNGITPWSDPIQFQANGCLPDNIYGDPASVYRIEFRQGPNQTYPLIGNPIQNYIFGNGSASPVIDSALNSDNMITNPQFADIYFESPLTIAVAGTYSIAPGWSIVLTGAGSCTLTQVELSGSNDIVGNPPYALQIQTTSFSTAQLIQKFSNNGALFGGGLITFAMTAIATSVDQTITAYYEPSFSSSGNQQIFNKPISTGGFAAYAGFANLVASTNTDDGQAAYVNIVINLLGTGNVQLTNIQVTGQTTQIADFTISDVPPFLEETYERTVDHEFHVYKPKLSYKPIPSYLVGWDFPLNPGQFAGRSIAAQAVGAGKSYYAWDQTILFQSANSGITAAGTTTGALNLTAAATTQMAMIQYLDQVQAAKILQDEISCNLYANSATVSGLGVPVTVTLWYTTGSLPSTIGSNLSLVTALDANGFPTVAAGWTQITTQDLQNNFAKIVSGASYVDYPFNGWNVGGSSAAATATFFAIVVGTGSITSGDSIQFQSVGLMSGSIPTRPAPLTQDEVIRQCQYYYESSYNSGVVPGASDINGAQYISLPVITDGTITECWPKTIFQKFKQIKYTNSPVITFYTPTGTAANVSGVVISGTGVSVVSATNIALSKWTINSLSADSASYVVNNTNAYLYHANADHIDYEGILKYHYTCDARLGQ